MRSFKKFVDEDEQDPEDELDEGALRNFGAAVLFSRVVSQSKKIKRTKDVGEKLDLFSDQNVTLAGLTMAVGKFLEKSNR
jgi:hypothetical protein